MLQGYGLELSRRYTKIRCAELTYYPHNANHAYRPVQQTPLQYDCLAYLLDCLAGDIVSLLLADFIIHSR